MDPAAFGSSRCGSDCNPNAKLNFLLRFDDPSCPYRGIVNAKAPGENPAGSVCGVEWEMMTGDAG